MSGKKIVVFGCDNAGKTTLCEELKHCFRNDKYKVEVVKSIGANKSVEQYMAFMKDNLERKQVIIFDRFPIIEEATCGKVLRENDLFFQKWMNNEVIDILKKVDVFVFCYPGLMNVLNWGSREQMDGVKDNILQLINAYNEMTVTLLKLGMKVVEYNYSVDKTSDIYRRL